MPQFQKNEEGIVVESQTFGEKAVGLTFNPSNSGLVFQIKKSHADLIDLLQSEKYVSEDPEVKRMYSIAITELQTAQMWAVKAATWK